MAEEQQTTEELYRALIPNLKRLETECKYIIEEALQQAGVKTHSLLSRVKAFESAQEKLIRKEKIESLDLLEDLLGLRVVCLLRSDITRIGELIRNEFDVVAEDNKLDGADIEVFGYQSVHFIAKLNVSCKGRRYNDLHDRLFEIQLRTVAMDAWATLSHYLDYKTELDVPSDLRKDFFALSGLFYVADTHFEIFYAAKKKSEHDSEARIHSTSLTINEELNLDTLRAFLRHKYPDKASAGPAALSIFLKELIESGYTDFGKIDRAIESASPLFKEYEAIRIAEQALNRVIHTFADTGAARLTLLIADGNYRYLGDHKRAEILAKIKSQS